MKVTYLFVLMLSCISTFSQTVNDGKTEKYHFKVKLTKTVPLPPHCGIMAFALLLKFEVLSTDFKDYNKKFVFLIQPCPEFLGLKFFKKGKVYEADVATNSEAAFTSHIVNPYKKVEPPVFWIREINKVN